MTGTQHAPAHRTKRTMRGLPLVVIAGLTAIGCSATTIAASPRPTAPKRGLEPAWWEEVTVLSTPISSSQRVATAPAPCTLRIVAPSDVLFAPGSAVVERVGRAELEKLAASQLSNAIEVTVSGATDSRGSEQQNLELSRNRARNVVAVLRRGHLQNVTFTTFALGETHPVADERGPDPDTAMAQNRRVEIQATVSSCKSASSSRTA